MKINKNNLIINNLILRFTAKPNRVKTGILVLCKIIFTLGISLKKTKTKQQWDYAFKGKKVSKKTPSVTAVSSNKTDVSSPQSKAKKLSNSSLKNVKHDHNKSVKSDVKSKTENKSANKSEHVEHKDDTKPEIDKQIEMNDKSSEFDKSNKLVDAEIEEDVETSSSSTIETDSSASEEYLSCGEGNLTAEDFDKLRVSAREIIKKKKFSSENFEENLATASSLALSLFTRRKQLLTYEDMKDKIALKAGMEDQEELLKEKIFKRTFKSFMEAKEAVATASGDGIRAVESGVATKKLFGDEVFQVKLISDKEEITYVAKMARIGEGSFNEVYLAADILNGKIRVFRELHVDYSDEADLLKRLKIENALQAELQKISDVRKGIIKIHATSETGSILSFANKGSLAEAITQQNLTNVEKQAVVEGIVKALCNLHKAGTVFGDFKSDNILLKHSKTGSIKVKFADFGGSYRPAKDAPPYMATPDYFSPEMLSIGPLTDEATDRWALGILMYEMKAYSTPQFHSDAYDLLEFDGKDPKEQVRTVQGLIKEGLNRPSLYLDIYDPYDQIIIDLLKYEPSERIALDEVCERLKDVPLESYSKS